MLFRPSAIIFNYFGDKSLFSCVILCLIQMDYPFADFDHNYDPFDQSLAQNYDVYYNSLPPQPQLPLPQEVKLQEGTSPCRDPPPPTNPPLFPPAPSHLDRPQKPKEKKGRSVQKKRQDEDYNPRKRSKKGRAGGKKIVKQKEDRNMIPNSVQHVLAFVQKRYKSEAQTEKIFRIYPPPHSCMLTRFYVYHRLLRVKVNCYVNQNALRLVTEPGELDYDEFGREEQSYYCMVSRMLIRYYLKNEAVLYILGSRKVKRENVIEHLRIQRYLFQNLKMTLN